MVLINRLDKVADRKLEERSYIMFEFPEAGRDLPIRRILPFFENVDIEETRRSNYIRYQPVSRNSTLLAYAGAESRILNINFSMTLPNIIEYFDTIFSNYVSKYRSKSELRGLFLKGPNSFETFDPKAAKGSAQDFEDFFHDIGVKREDIESKSQTQQSNIRADGNNPQTGLNPLSVFSPNPAIAAALVGNDIETNRTRQRVIDTVMYWVNLIRSSSLNNAKNPTAGPPIIRLNHGILYQDIPTVCLDYKMNYNENAGFDLKTLFPRRIEISMSLQEVRSGDFTEYDPRHPIKRDNIVGWEAMIGGTNSIDPIRQDIGTRFTFK
jgi:hypothetical protein